MKKRIRIDRKGWAKESDPQGDAEMEINFCVPEPAAGAAAFSQHARLLFISRSLGLTSVHQCVVFSGQMSRKRGKKGLLLLLIRANSSDLTRACSREGTIMQQENRRKATNPFFPKNAARSIRKITLRKIFQRCTRALLSLLRGSEGPKNFLYYAEKVSVRIPSKVPSYFSLRLHPRPLDH